MQWVGEGIALGRQGDYEGAQDLFYDLWDTIGEYGDPFQRVAVAHSMADVQDTVEQELKWNLRALEAADELAEDELAEGGFVDSVVGFQPPLHLNIADCYRRLGKVDLAREHHAKGVAALGELEDRYATIIRDGFERLAHRLSSPAVT
jgi:tetratricopeptide (TPR) repeat protein